jgi:hydrogenase/urease accessory protein HupE
MKHRILKQLTLLVGASLVSGASFAHPSLHHQLGFIDGIRHMLTQPYHLLVLFGAIALLVFVLNRLITTKQTSRHKDK